MLWKLFIYYEWLEIFEEALKLFVYHIEGIKQEEDDNDDFSYLIRRQRTGMTLHSEQQGAFDKNGNFLYQPSPMTWDEKQEYEFDEIVTDAFNYSL